MFSAKIKNADAITKKDLKISFALEKSKMELKTINAPIAISNLSGQKELCSTIRS